MSVAGDSTGRRASPRRQHQARPRLPGGCAARRARGCVHACEPCSAPQHCVAAWLLAGRAAPRARHCPGRSTALRPSREGQGRDPACAPSPREAMGFSPNTWTAACKGGHLNQWASERSNLSGPPHGPCDPLRPSNGLFSTPLPWTWTSGWFPRLQSTGLIGPSPVGHFRPSGTLGPLTAHLTADY
jgi:hypothetical protein